MRDYISVGKIHFPAIKYIMHCSHLLARNAALGEKIRAACNFTQKNIVHGPFFLIKQTKLNP